MNVGSQGPLQALEHSPAFISLIPPETLAIILQFVLPNDELNSHILLDLTIVCRKWRDTVYSHPRFWTNYRCSTYSPTSGRRSEGLVPHLQRWFERAGALPLMLKLTMTPTHPTPEELPALISFLIRTTRWHSLHLKLVADPEIGRADTGLWLNSLFSAAGEALREEGSSPWETLQQLEIEARDVRLQEFIRLPFATIAPNLRELMISLRQIPNAYQLVDGFVNPKKLCRLEIDAHINWKDDILPTFYYQTLAQATNLECVKVLDHYCGSELFDFDFSATVSSFPVSNCTLTTLALHDNRATRDCLQNLSLPSLTSLTFISSTSGLDFDFSLSLSVVVGRLIDRSDCKIKHVRLENTPKLRSLCVQLIRLLTTVEILELHLPSSPSWHSPLLLKRMSAQALDDTDPILPNLTSFSVSLSSPITGEIKEAFTDFVEHPSRWPASEEGGAVNLPGAVQCARLENAHLFYCGSMSTSMEYARGRRSG